jgi:OOP family OmpA-OmpF porin
MTRSAVAFVTVLGTLAAASTSATAGVEIGGTAGIHLFAQDNALGTKTDDVVHHKNSALFAARLGVTFGMLGVELEGGAIPTETGDANTTFDVWSIVARGHVIATLRADDPTNSFLPFFLAGGGIMRIVDIGIADRSLLRYDTDGVVYAGAGVKYRAGGGWGVRFDARLLLPPSNEDKTFTIEGEALLSLYREWGRKEAPKAPPPKTDDDPDKDGIVGASDQCPDDAEDKDGFEDENGCPDPDNDGDGVPDESDKCATEPEDKDNFQDDDGCPDPDNDEDGVADASDKCVDQPETKNGFEDEDGCPDEIPEKLAKFTGTIQGITFKTNSADLAGGSTKVLDKAIAVLTEFTNVRLEIQGHTDDQPLKNTKKFADNDALSQARAESVKAYFVKKGIAEDRLVAKGYGATQPVTDPAGLKGGALKKARAQNRRVEFKLVPAEGAAEPKAEEPKEEPKAEDKPAEDAPPAE